MTVKSLEKRILTLEKKYITLYNRFYAMGMRKDREEAHRRHLNTSKRWTKRFERFSRGQFHQLGRLLGGLKQGKTIMLLDARQKNLLNQKLAGRCGWNDEGKIGE